MLILDTAAGKIKNEARRTIGLGGLLWTHDAPRGRATWRWYTAADGRQVAAVTLE